MYVKPDGVGAWGQAGGGQIEGGAGAVVLDDAPYAGRRSHPEAVLRRSATAGAGPDGDCCADRLRRCGGGACADSATGRATLDRIRDLSVGLRAGAGERVGLEPN